MVRVRSEVLPWRLSSLSGNVELTLEAGMGRIHPTDIITAITTCCALTVTGILVYQQFIVRIPPNVTGAPLAPIQIGGEDTLAGTGHARGSASPLVTIIEFADFECPFCKQFSEGALSSFLQANPSEVRLVYRHWPLPMHRFSYPAAKAAECAASQGGFWPMHDALYKMQDSLGLLSFREFARRAGVPDLDAFDSCYSTPGTVQKIERDIAVAKGVGGSGTPTVIINGWRFNGRPPPGSLDSILEVARRHL